MKGQKEMENEVVQYTSEELLNSEDYKVFAYVMAHKKEYETFEKKLRAALVTEMENAELKTMENDKIKVTYKAPSVRKVVDTEKMKAQGLYDLFVKESKTSASVTIVVK